MLYPGYETMADIFRKLLILLQLLQENTVQEEEEAEGQSHTVGAKQDLDAPKTISI